MDYVNWFYDLKEKLNKLRCYVLELCFFILFMQIGKFQQWLSVFINLIDVVILIFFGKVLFRKEIFLFLLFWVLINGSKISRRSFVLQNNGSFRGGRWFELVTVWVFNSIFESLFQNERLEIFKALRIYIDTKSW